MEAIEVVKTEIKPVCLAPMIVEIRRALGLAVMEFGVIDDLDPDSIIVAIQTKGPKKAKGWYCNGAWIGKDGVRRSELTVAAEHLDKDVGEIVLHEMAHAVNAAKGISDCNAAQMHNKHFKIMAERCGLEVGERDPKFGYGITELNASGSRFLRYIDFNQAIFSAFRQPEDKDKKKAPKTYTYKCTACDLKVTSPVDDLKALHKACDAWFEKSGRSKNNAA